MALVATTAPFARADAAVSPLRWRLWRVTRVGAAARPFGIDVAITPTAPGPLALVVSVRGSGSGRRVVTAQFWEDGGSRREVYREGSSTELCPGTTCPTEETGRAQFRVGNDQPVRDEFFILTWAAKATTTFDRDRPGWVVREVAAPRARRVVAASARATGASLDGRTVEHFSGATAPGGKRGSIAWASVPCDQAGVGDAELSANAGAGSRTTLDCQPTTPTPTDHAAVVGHASRWSVTGTVVGAAYLAPRTRLLVLDLPA